MCHIPLGSWLFPERHRLPDLHDNLRDFNADADIRRGILTHTGHRAFSVGGNIKTPRPEKLRAQSAAVCKPPNGICCHAISRCLF